MCGGAGRPPSESGAGARGIAQLFFQAQSGCQSHGRSCRLSSRCLCSGVLQRVHACFWNSAFVLLGMQHSEATRPMTIS